MNVDRILEIWNEEHGKSKCLNETIIRFASRIEKIENDRIQLKMDKLENILLNKNNNVSYFRKISDTEYRNY